jgi:hypothetical protein
MRLLCDLCGATNRPLVQWCHVCGHRIGEPPAAPLPIVADLSRDERARWRAALDAHRAVSARVVMAYLFGGWFGWHRFRVADQLGGLLRALAAALALMAAFGLDVADPRYVAVPVVALGALWIADAAFLPGLLKQHREEAERRFLVDVWRAREDAEQRGPRGGR